MIDHFFPKELRSQKFEIDNYLCFLKIHTCCRCTKTCRYYGTCCIDAFFNNNMTSLKEYVDVFFKITTIKKHVKTLPVVKLKNISIKFSIEELPMVASCQNKHSNYESNCNRNRLSNDIGVMADKFLYKNKYCALYHGFNEFNYITLELIGCKTSTNTSGVKMTVPSQSCILKILEDKKVGYEKKKQFFISSFPQSNKWNCSKQDNQLCLHSYFALLTSLKNSYTNPYCAKCNGETDLVNKVCWTGTISTRISRPKPHFRLFISFDDDDKSNNVLDNGNPICPGNQYLDILQPNVNKRFTKPNGTKIYIRVFRY